jgi:catechol 2,3-dioxygenase-like lactoylglutathione lyase family enzyme
MSEQEFVVKGTDFVFVPVTSAPKAEEFYNGVLGLECSARYNNHLGAERFAGAASASEQRGIWR